MSKLPVADAARINGAKEVDGCCWDCFDGAYEERVGDDSESFGEDFWTSLDGVANALDNVQARLFVDRCCVAHGLPLLESGTSGLKWQKPIIKESGNNDSASKNSIM